MINIFLFRHGKSNWTNPDHTDSERPLAKRGLRDVPIMSKIISEKCSNIDLILCSSSKRTQETLELSLSVFSKKPEIKILDELYLASSDRLLSILNENILSHNNIILIGHNPGLFDFVNEIDDNFLFLLEKENHLGEYTPLRIKGSNVHVMNKFSLNRIIDRGEL